MVDRDVFSPLPPMPERPPRPYTTYDYIAGLLNGNNDRDLIGELSDSVAAIAAPASIVPVQDTRLENLEAALVDTHKRLAELEKAAAITPAPLPTPKPIPEPKPIPVPDIVPVIVEPVKPVKTVKQSVKKRKTKGQTEKTVGKRKVKSK